MPCVINADEIQYINHTGFLAHFYFNEMSLPGYGKQL